MPGRHWGAAYKFGFNGQEKEEEVSGEGNTNTAQFWEYDTRLSRRWNIDIKYKHYRSNYSAFGLNPILNVDPLGDDFYRNNITGTIEEHPSFWYDDLPDSKKLSYNYVSKYKATDWSGTPYYNDDSRFYTLAKWMKFDRSLEGHDDPMNLGATEQETRVAKDVVIIGGGVLTIVASGGTGTPVVLASFGFLSGSMAVAGGTAKLVMDGRHDFKVSDKVPTGYLSGTVGALAEYSIGDGNDKRLIYVKGALTITEGAITFAPYKMPTELVDISSKTLTITNIAIDGDFNTAV
ncbi:MAG: hypothetical protein JST76_01400, partial [Bacteroidetes bacterium]|nr:hypothetical protein [Bacteroidota bacterium]